MRQSKEEHYILEILTECRNLSKERLTGNDCYKLRKFIQRRLIPGGRNGYQFLMALYYKKHYVIMKEQGSITKVAQYTLENNHYKLNHNERVYTN